MSSEKILRPEDGFWIKLAILARKVRQHLEAEKEEMMNDKF